MGGAGGGFLGCVGGYGKSIDRASSNTAGFNRTFMRFFSQNPPSNVSL